MRGVIRPRFESHAEGRVIYLENELARCQRIVAERDTLINKLRSELNVERKKTSDLMNEVEALGAIAASHLDDGWSPLSEDLPVLPQPPSLAAPASIVKDLDEHWDQVMSSEAYEGSLFPSSLPAAAALPPDGEDEMEIGGLQFGEEPKRERAGTAPEPSKKIVMDLFGSHSARPQGSNISNELAAAASEQAFLETSPTFVHNQWLDTTNDNHTDQLKPLAQLLLVENNIMAAFLCRYVDHSQTEVVAKALSQFYQHHACMLPLLNRLINYEVNQTIQEGTVFRGNSMTTKLVTQFCRRSGSHFLEVALSHVISSSLDGSQSIADCDESASLMRLAQRSLDSIIASLPIAPVLFRQIGGYVYEAVEKRFPGSGLKAVGSFVFLRFFCPALVAPEGFKLIVKAPTSQQRRKLILVSKTLQNLSNGVSFGQKEDHMLFMNAFLSRNSERLSAFLLDFATPDTTTTTETPLCVPPTLMDESLFIIARQIDRHSAKLSMAVGVSVVETFSFRLGDRLTDAIVDYGQRKNKAAASEFLGIISHDEMVVLMELIRAVSSEVSLDDFVSALVRLVSGGLLDQSLLWRVIRQEIDSMPSDVPSASILRNTFSVRLFAHYAALAGRQVQSNVLGSFVHGLMERDEDLEPDERRARGGVNAYRNQERVAALCNEALDTILRQPNAISGPIRDILRFIHVELAEKYPESVSEAVTRILFIQFWIPAIASPDRWLAADPRPFSTVSSSSSFFSPPTPSLNTSSALSHNVRRTLVLISKSLRHIVCGTTFPEATEPFMYQVNKQFVERRSEGPDMSLYLEQVLAPGAPDVDLDDGIVELSTEQQIDAVNILHREIMTRMHEVVRNLEDRRSSSTHEYMLSERLSLVVGQLKKTVLARSKNKFVKRLGGLRNHKSESTAEVSI